METTKKESKEFNMPTTTGGSYPTGGSATQAAPRPEAKEPGQQASEFIDQTKQAASEAYDKASRSVSQAYDKTSQTLNATYDQAMDYGRDNPGKLTLIAFGAGIGVGILLAGGFGSRSRTSRIVPPVVDALSQIAREVFR